MTKRKSPYETLGVKPDATPEQIKKARKRKAGQHHPDVGGDPAAMAEVNQAYDVLINPERRRLYDTTGEDRKQVPLDEEARQMLLQVFQAVLLEDAPLTAARRVIGELQEKAADQKRDLEARRATLEKRAGKVQVKEGDNLFQMLLDQQLQHLNNGIAFYTHALEVCQSALALLEAYTSDEKAPKKAPFDEEMRAYFGTYQYGVHFR